MTVLVGVGLFIAGLIFGAFVGATNALLRGWFEGHIPRTPSYLVLAFKSPVLGWRWNKERKMWKRSKPTVVIRDKIVTRSRKNEQDLVEQYEIWIPLTVTANYGEERRLTTLFDASMSVCNLTQNVEGRTAYTQLSKTQTDAQVKYLIRTEQTVQFDLKYGFTQGDRPARQLVDFERPFEWEISGLFVRLEEGQYRRHFPKIKGRQRFTA